MIPEPLIQVRGLSKAYRGKIEPVLNGLDLDVQPGEFYGLLGPNGAGKTSLMNILCGLVPYKQGTVRVTGSSPADFNALSKSRIGLVPQDIALYDKLSARENLHFFGSAYRIPHKELRERTEHYLRIFGLEKHASRPLKTYSGGMKRRVNLIAGILHGPDLLFLDEPTVGIDVQSRNVIVEFLAEYNRSGHTVFYTSHHMREAETLCSRVGIIDSGVIIADGTPAELMRQHACETLESMFLKLTGKDLRDE